MLLEFKDIHKSFGEVAVLKGIRLALETGSVLGLVGENGAGKSTLMNILGGIVPLSSGKMELSGKVYSPDSPNDAQTNGIAFIHQELNLFPNLSIAENLFIVNFPKKKVMGCHFLDRKTAREKTEKILSQVGLDVSPNMPVANLTAAQRQMVEIAKALSTNPKIVIFDEPTTSLTRHEAQKLFNLIRSLKNEGLAIVFISHNLDDVMQLTDHIAVLRDGELIAHDETTSYTIPTLVNLMIGRDMGDFIPRRDTVTSGETCLEVSGLKAGYIGPLDFSIEKGEVLGFYGLVGAGRSEMIRMVYGLDPMEMGTLRWNGRKMHNLNPVKWIKQGVAFLTENRQDEGLMIDQTIAKNVQLAVLPRYTKSLNRVDYKEVGKRSRAQADAVNTKYQNFTTQVVSTLSGGNQQKVVLAKWLLTKPELLILDEPTKGIDIGAKHEIYTLINALVKSGSSTVLISSEIEELLGLCDRIIVMSEGRISREFKKEEFERSAILEAALHHTEEEVL
ncbi:sugar ABC transporter ATP-binding protein [Ulvibacterium sp.]|uniref:sugar ABC transporter ATP-binding protein n=1 Tax=Ulvibacterium sp. TaxID=2665914 RepID=UPI002611CFD2|nr:sugar ABC transporter ATP-binding protein [Ulvibacterium sp.]